MLLLFLFYTPMFPFLFHLEVECGTLSQKYARLLAGCFSDLTS